MISSGLVLALVLLATGGATSTALEQPQEISGGQPPVGVQVVGHQPHGGVVVHAGAEEPQHAVGPIPVGAVEHQQHQQQHQSQVVPAHQQQPQQPQYYSPSGVIQVVGQGEQVQQPQQYGVAGVKPQQQQQQQQPIIKQYSSGAGPEQYGQPEPASLPPNYKPFGSWGLYIGGNPADGYYSSYYKALGQSVAQDKQQVEAAAAAGPKPGSPQAIVVSQASGMSPGGQSPMLKQGAFPYNYQDQAYPYDSYYTPADLSSGSRVNLVPQVGYPAAQYGPSVFNYVEQPASSGAGAGSLSYASDLYASTKRAGNPPAGSFATKSRDVQGPAPKGYHHAQQQQQQGYYSYAAGSPIVYQPVAGQEPGQVVAYPVPVGSQIVGSQPDVEGSFQPYGVHGFTRYAIKPTMVSQITGRSVYQQQNGVQAAQGDQSSVGVAGGPVKHFRSPYKSQVAQAGYQQPLSFYGYPLSQLHYSQGSIAPIAFSGESHSIESGPSSSPVSPIVGGGVGGVGGVQHSQVSGVVGEQPASVVHSPVGYSVEAAGSEKSETKVEQQQPVASKPVAHSKPTQQ